MTFTTRLVLLLCLALTAHSATADPVASWPHIRYDDPLIGDLLAHGAHSPTFVDLRDRIERSDVIVVIDRRPCSGRGHGGTQFLTDAGGYRYLRVTLQISGVGNAETALLGHELRHVVELIDADGVRDEAGYLALYQRIGTPAACAAARCYDTAMAREVGLAVYEELRAAGPLRAPRPTRRERTRSSW